MVGSMAKFPALDAEGNAGVTGGVRQRTILNHLRLGAIAQPPGEG